MIIEIPYKSKTDGKVKLVKRIDGVYADDGITVIPTGFMIRKVGTNELYNEAIDVENASFTYEETDEPIDSNINNEDEISGDEFLSMIKEVL